MINPDNIIKFRETLTLEDLIVIAQSRYKNNIYQKAYDLGLYNVGFSGNGLGKGFLSLITKWIKTNDSIIYRVAQALYYENPSEPPKWYKGTNGEWRKFFDEVYTKKLLSIQSEKSPAFDSMPYHNLVNKVEEIYDMITVDRFNMVSENYSVTSSHVETLIGLAGCEKEERRMLKENLSYNFGIWKKSFKYNYRLYKESEGNAKNKTVIIMPLSIPHTSTALKISSAPLRSKAPQKTNSPKTHDRHTKELNPDSPLARLINEIGTFVYFFNEGFELPYTSLNFDFSKAEQLFRAISSLRENYNFLHSMIRIGLYEISLHEKPITLEHDIPLEALIAYDLSEDAFYKGIMDEEKNIDLLPAGEYYGIGNLLDKTDLPDHEIRKRFLLEIEQFKRYKEIREKINSLTQDKKINLQRRIDSILLEIQDFILPQKLTGEYDQNNAFVTIISPEAKGFSGKKEIGDYLVTAYKKFAKITQRVKKNWEVEIIEDDLETHTITLHVKGKYAYGLLKGEDKKYGFHLFRYDEHDAKISVFVEPEIEKREFKIDRENDVQKTYIESHHIGGQGGKKKGSLQMVHTPTGISVKIRSRHDSMEEKEEYGFKLLEAKVAARYASLHVPETRSSGEGTLRSYLIENRAITRIIDYRNPSLNLKLTNHDANSILQGNLFPLIYAFYNVYFG